MQWRVPNSPDTLVQRFGRAGCDSSIQAVAILIAEKAYFSKSRIEKRKAEFAATPFAGLKRKSDVTSRVPEKCVTLWERGNLCYAQVTEPEHVNDDSISSAMEVDAARASGVNDEANTKESGDSIGPELDEGGSQVDYSPNDPEDGWILHAVKTRSSKVPNIRSTKRLKVGS